MRLSPFKDGIPIVASNAERAALFPSPNTDQRVHNKDSGWIERWNGSRWDGETPAGLTDAAVFNVMNPRFGAAGDDTTDDAAAIRACASAAPEGAFIEIPRGKTFRVRSTLLFRRGQTVFGGGKIRFDPVTSSTAGAAISNIGATSETGYTADGDITVRDITIECTGGSGVLMAHADGVRIINVRFLDWHHHMVDIPGCKNVLVTGCYGLNTLTGNVNGSGIQFDRCESGAGAILGSDGSTETPVHIDNTACQDVAAIGNQIAANPQSFGLHLHRTGHAGVTFADNIVRGCLYGLQTDTACTFTDILIRGNQFIASTDHAIAFQGAGVRLVIEGNIVDGVTTNNGIWCNASSGNTEVVIQGNIVRDVVAAAIRLVGASDFTISNNEIFSVTGGTRRAIVVVNSSYGSVSGNSIDGNMTSGSDMFPAIYLVRDDAAVMHSISVTGNHIRRIFRGVFVSADSDGLSITGNAMEDILDRAILIGDGSLTYDALGCSIHGNAIADVEVSGIVLENPSYCSVSGNTVRDVAGSASTGRGIQLAGTGTHNTITGNVIDGVNSSAEYGLLIATTHTTVVGNTITRFLTGTSPATTPLTGTIFANNIIRDNATANSTWAGADHFFAMNFIGDQTTPIVIKQFQLTNSTGAHVLTGTASPEGAVTAPVGSIFLRQDGGANTSIYVKESGAGNTGWVAK